MIARLKVWLARHRDLMGKFAFELAIVFVGVTAAFALENVRQQAEDAHYTASLLAALRPTFANVADHATQIDATITQKLTAYDAAIARGERPMPPVYREEGAERPPTRNWDAVVAAGGARSIDPELFFALGRFYNGLDSFGERYIRYNDFTESRVFAVGDDPAVFYDAKGVLKPEYRAYIDRLRDLQDANLSTITDARRLSDRLAAAR